MLYFVYCQDAPGKSNVRRAERDSHLHYMAKYDQHIILGGPTLDQEDDKADGTALVLNFQNIDAVHTFLDGDPFFKAGLFASRLVKPFQPVRIAPEVLEPSPDPTPGDTE